MSLTTSVDIQQNGLRSFFGLLWGHAGFRTTLFTGTTVAPATLTIRSLIGDDPSCLDDCWCYDLTEISGEVVVSLERHVQRSQLQSFCPEHRVRFHVSSRGVTATGQLRCPSDDASESERREVAVEIRPVELLIHNSGTRLDDGRHEVHVDRKECLSTSTRVLSATDSASIADGGVLRMQLISSSRHENGVLTRRIQASPFVCEEGVWKRIRDEVFWPLCKPSGRYEIRRLDILRCQQSVLYRSSLKHLLPHAVLIQLPIKFVQWLANSEFTVERDDDGDDHSNDDRSRESSLSSSDLESSSRSSSQADMYQRSEEFRNVKTAIDEGLLSLGGQAFPKLHWSCPKDAKWMLGGRLVCESSREILLLLRGSVWIAHDLDTAFAKTVDPVSLLPTEDSSNRNSSNEHSDPYFFLCLKQPLVIMEGFEFRVFFFRLRILGISQRDLNACFTFLADDVKLQVEITDSVLKFFASKLLPRLGSLHLLEYPNEQLLPPLDRGAFDVYFTRRSEDKPLHCKLLDLSPWGATTDSLLYDWDELRDFAYQDVPTATELRYVRLEMAGKRMNPEDQYRLPVLPSNMFL